MNLKFLTGMLSAALLSSLFVSPAYGSDTPPALTPGQLGLSGDELSVTYPQWELSGYTEEQLSGFTEESALYACSSSQTAVSSPSSVPVVDFGICTHMSETNNYGFITVSNLDLKNLYIRVSSNWVPYLSAAELNGHEYKHIIVANSLANYSIEVVWSSRTASREFGATNIVEEIEEPAVEPGLSSYDGPQLFLSAGQAHEPGGRVVISGSNLDGVSKVSIDGLDANVKVNSAGELEITVPASLKPGVYDLVLVSGFGTLTVQDGLRVSGTASAVGVTSEARPSTKLKEDNTVKVHVFDVVGAGKVQIFVNDKEIAWVNAKDSSNPKLIGGYLARTINLAPGKNVIEVYVDGKRVDRKAYTN